MTEETGWQENTAVEGPSPEFQAKFEAMQEEAALQRERGQGVQIGGILGRPFSHQEALDNERRRFALERAIAFTDSPDPADVTKNAKVFEAYLKGEPQ